MTESFFTTLKTAAESVGISVTDNQCEKLYKFYETVVEYNKNVNLTAITDEKEFIVKHIVDSISAAKFIKENAAVVDIGAGAGFPSIPLKIIRDDIVLIMLDALSKRVDFLNFAVSELSLKNAKAKHLRAEEAGEKLLRGSADVVVARAVGQTNILLELSIPLLKKHGVFINYKGKDLSDVETAKTAEAALNAKKPRFSISVFLLTSAKETSSFTKRLKTRREFIRENLAQSRKIRCENSVFLFYPLFIFLCFTKIMFHKFL